MNNSSSPSGCAKKSIFSSMRRPRILQSALATKDEAQPKGYLTGFVHQRKIKARGRKSPSLRPTRWGVLMMKVSRWAEETTRPASRSQIASSGKSACACLEHTLPMRKRDPFMHRLILLDRSGLLQSIRTTP